MGRGGEGRGGLRVRGVYSGVDVEIEEEDVVGEVYGLFDKTSGTGCWMFSASFFTAILIRDKALR